MKDFIVEPRVVSQDILCLVLRLLLHFLHHIDKVLLSELCSLSFSLNWSIIRPFKLHLRVGFDKHSAFWTSLIQVVMSLGVYMRDNLIAPFWDFYSLVSLAQFFQMSSSRWIRKIYLWIRCFLRDFPNEEIFLWISIFLNTFALFMNSSSKLVKKVEGGVLNRPSFPLSVYSICRSLLISIAFKTTHQLVDSRLILS